MKRERYDCKNKTKAIDTLVVLTSILYRLAHAEKADITCYIRSIIYFWLHALKSSYFRALSNLFEKDFDK